MVVEKFRPEGVELDNTSGCDVIKCITPEGKEINYDFEEIRDKWIEFFLDHDLDDMANELLELEIKFSDEQKERIKNLIEKKGFNFFILMPSDPSRFLEDIGNATTKPTDNDVLGYKKEKVFMDRRGYVSEYYPDKEKGKQNKIRTINRPENELYLILMKVNDSLEVDEETTRLTNHDAEDMFKKQGLSGMTIEEYLLYQRRIAEERKEHSDVEFKVMLLSSELESGDTLVAGWDNSVLTIRITAPEGIEFRRNSDKHVIGARFGAYGVEVINLKS